MHLHGNLLKWLNIMLYAFNSIFLAIGLGLVIFGIVLLALFGDYFTIIGHALDAVSVLLIFVGVIIIIVASFGFVGAHRRNYCMVLTYSVFLSVIFILEVAISISALHLQNSVQDLVEDGLSKSLNEYANANVTQQAWDSMQSNLECCGVDNGPADWEDKLEELEDLLYPKSCCIDQESKGCGKDPSAKSAYQRPCVPTIRDFIAREVSWISLLGIIMGLIQIVGILFSCFVAYSIDKGYESL